MKRLICLLLLVLWISLSADWVELSNNGSNEIFDYSSVDLSQTTIYFDLDGYETENITESGNDFLKISHPRGGYLLEVGMPDLPVFSNLIAIPDKGVVNYNVRILEEEIISISDIYPRQPLQTESSREVFPFTLNEDFYRSSSVFPENSTMLDEPAVLRDHRVVNLTVLPFQYIPEEGNLRIIKRMEIDIQTSGEGGINEKTTNHYPSRFFQPLYEASILNYDILAGRDSEFQQPSYLFIYPNNSTVLTYLEYISDWKHQKGFEVTLASTATTGTSTSSIKNYIQNAYNNWENPPEFICLIGDAQGGSYTVPTWIESWSGYSGEGDHPYTQLDGTDILADAFIGRLSFQSLSGSNSFQTIISKILNYEKEPYMTSTNWYRDVILAGDPSISGASCVITKQNIKEVIEHNNSSMGYSEIYSGSFPSQIVSNINSGGSYFNYRGWLGMSSFDNGDINGLSNGFKLPLATIITCGTGSFRSQNEASSEAFLRAGTSTTPRGAVACIGTATTGTHTTFNNCVDAGIYHGIFSDKIYNPGGSLVKGKLDLYNNFPSNPSNKVFIFSYWNNLMGDPGLELWTDIPQDMVVTYDSQVAQGTNFIEVMVENTSNRPIEGAWVTALMGDDVIFATGMTDASGNIILEIEAEQTGTVTLTVTAHNYVPHLGSFTVVQDDLYLSVFELQIDDDNSGTSDGNDDGVVNPGEDIELKVSLKNYGTSSATSVSGSLTSGTPGVSITDGSETYGTITSGNSSYSSDDFDFSVPADALGGMMIDLNLDITGNAREEWNDLVRIIVEGPNFSVTDYVIQDGNNGILDPGETSDFAVTISNDGGAAGTSIVANISSSVPGISFIDSYGTYGTVNADMEKTNTTNNFEVEVDNQLLPGTQVSCQLTITNSSGFYQEVDFLLAIGDIDQTDPTGPDEYGYYMYDDGDTQYSLAPFYSWVEINPSLGGSGTSLGLSDGGNTGDIADIALPFAFYFYGTRYSSATVCSNGWISLGSTDQYSFMNWQLPSSLGPSPMIAPFWDDLKTSGGQVYYYNDTANHRYIIEWSNMRNEYDNSYETFQVILYNEAYYPTPTGDGEILFQYNVVNNVDQGSYSGGYVSHGQFASVGIENASASGGLEYSYDNAYPASAKPLTNNMAVLITTNIASVVTPPAANFSIDQFDFMVEPGNSDDQILQISNSGEANLIYSISKDYQDTRDIDITRDSGGPDSYGYQWLDSNEPNGPDYDWVDISGYGSLYNFTSDDQASSLINIGFSFPFYGNEYTQVRINSNGFLSFTSTSTNWSNESIPNTNEPNNMIAPFWDDLSPQNSGTVHYYSDSVNDRFIVQFTDVPHYGSSYPGQYTFQCIMYENGRILYQYNNLQQTINSVTIGIENSTGTDGLEIAYNENYVENGLAILIKTVLDWAQVVPSSGSIVQGGSDQVEVSVDTSELEIGEYLCNLIITTNDPNSSSVIMPLNLIVDTSVITTPQNLAVQIGGGAIQLTWDAVPNADSYKVYGSLSPYAPFESWILVGSGITNNQWISILSSHYRYFKVTAIRN